MKGSALPQDSRRNFLGTAATAATALAGTQVLGANDLLRFGLIGAGDRGQQLLREALAIPQVELVGVADAYTRRLEQAKALKEDVKTYLDHRYLLEDKSLDAVLIATPPHLHCEHFVASLEAGKHVYQEKTMAFSVEHAKRMREAYQRAGKRTVQIGHQSLSSGLMEDATSQLRRLPMGKITAIVMQMYRNTPHGKPQWSRPVLPDMTAENILWKSFLGEARGRECDAQRSETWRLLCDATGRNV